MDRFEAMKTLVAVVDHRSLSAAGRSLRVPVTSISRRITDLEAQLGTRLLLRTTRRLTLTDAGIAYVAAARRIVGEVEDAEREVAGELQAPKGELLVTAPVLFGRLHVLPVVSEFLAQFAEINVRLLLQDRNLHLVDDGVDMAVRIGRLPDSTLVATRVGSMRTVVCASPRLIAAHGEPRVAEDLQRFPWVAVDTSMPIAAWKVPVAPRLTVSTAEAAADAAVRGVGATRLLHYQVAEKVNCGALRIVLEDLEPEPLPIHLVHPDRGYMPLKLRRFIDFAGPRLRAVLDQFQSLPPEGRHGSAR